MKSKALNESFHYRGKLEEVMDEGVKRSRNG